MRKESLGILVAGLLTCLAPPAYGSIVAAGAGGGGYLTAGAMLPALDDIIVIGGDVMGIMVSWDAGTSWQPWTAGLANVDEGESFYVEDLVGVSLANWNGFYAATRGGIYRGQVGSDWELMTPTQSGLGYVYKPDICDYPNRAMPIPFSALAWNGQGLLVAGAGHIRWNDSGQEEDYYPALAVGLDLTIPAPHVDGQYSVWTLDLNTPGAGWQPIAVASAPTGAVRDLSARATAGGTDIAVATSDGVWERVNGNWHSRGAPGGTDASTCWSIEYTPGGRLYAAFKAQGSSPSGVYRWMSNAWTWVGNSNPVQPQGDPLSAVGGRANLVYLSTSVNANGKDVLYLGCRDAAANDEDLGLYKCVVTNPFLPGSATWTHVVYRDRLGPGQFSWYPTGIDLGWADERWAPSVLFQPAVSPTDFNQVLAQFHTRLHVTFDAGTGWVQRYTNVEAGGPGWKTTGYNELVVTSIDFLADGSPVVGTADFGVFRGDVYHQYFEWMPAPVDPTGADPCQADDYEANYVHPRVNWRGTGGEVLFVSASNNIGQSGSGGVFIVDPLDQWHNITCSSLVNADRYLFGDLYHLTDYAIFVPYKRFVGVPGPGVAVDNYGVLLGRWIGATGDGSATDPGNWQWDDWSAGLVVGSAGKNAVVNHTIRNPYVNEDFLIAERSPTDDPGGFYHLNRTTMTWTKVFPTPAGQSSQYKDFHAMTQSQDGTVMYLGTSGRGGGVGRVLRWSADSGMSPADPSAWTPVSDGFTFGMAVPVAHLSGYSGVGCSVPAPWTLESAGNALTEVRALVVDRLDPDVVYVALHNGGALPQAGVWTYDHSTQSWSQFGDPLVGIPGRSLGISAQAPGVLLIGTAGQELYTVDLPGLLPAKEAGSDGTVRHRPIAFPELAVVPGGEPGVTIRFTSSAGAARLTLFDVRGRRVYHEEIVPDATGRAEVLWTGVDDRGLRVAGGIYFAQLENDVGSAGAKVLLLR